MVNNSTLTRDGLSIETSISNKDITGCTTLYNIYLSSFEEKPNIPLVAFLFESLESKRIPITQEIIDSIRYINSRSGL